MPDDSVSRTGAGVNKTVTLIVITIASFIMPLMASSVIVALPTIGRELAIEAVSMSWVTAAYVLAVAIFQVPFGRLADIYGRKKMFISGLILSIVASALCAISESAAMLIAFRALQGIGGAMSFSPGVAILTSVFPGGERGRAFGINAASVYFGYSAGPFIGGALTEHLGWRNIFFLAVLMGIFVIYLAFWKLKGEWIEAKGERYDIVGAAALCVFLGAGMYGFTMLPTIPGIGLVVLGVLGMLAFIWWEGKTESPIINLGLFRNNAVFVFSNLATLINYASVFAISFLLSLDLQYTKGLSPQAAGLVLVVSPVFMSISAPLAGRLSDRIEPQLVASAGMAFNCVALSLLVFLTDATPLGFIIASLVCYGLGNGFFSSPNTNAIMSSVNTKFLGVASGTIGTTRAFGQMFSMGIVMILFAIHIGQAQITPEYYPAFLTSMRMAFTIFAVLCFGGIFAQLAGRKQSEKKGRALAP